MADAIEIYPTPKVRHIKSISRRLGVHLNEILFFDDEKRNIKDVSSLGVTSVIVDSGIDIKVFHEGLRKYNRVMEEYYRE